ncbi:MAG: MarR family winged helix-turn-helix transcriptional regulator [Sedimentibacter sp.]
MNINRDIKKDNIFIMYSWKLKKMYEKAFYSIIDELKLAQAEADILLFLNNNKPLDTAKDITEYRFISKSMVSKSVESLLKKGYLSCNADSTDKRSIHLIIEPVAIPTVKKLLEVQKNFLSILFKDIAEDEYEATKRVLNKINYNISSEYEDNYVEDQNGNNTRK